MSDKTLLVGKIPFATPHGELAELFSRYGTTEAVHIMADQRTGRSRGFAFVEMGSRSQAEEAATELNGHLLGSVTLTVVLASPRHKVLHGTQDTPS